MPLGDSITWGSLSSTGNGYRGPLEELFSAAGVDVDFIGTRKHGSMADNDNQGHSGSFLAEIKEYSLLSVAARPNIILLHAGTNDMDLNRDVATAPDRLAAIIDQLLAKCPDASILVAQIIMSTDAAMQARTDAYNAAIAGLVRRYQEEQGRHVMAVDMSKILTRTDLADKKHPNDSGYRKMASAWRDAIQRANDAGWVKKPAPYEGFGFGLGLDGTPGTGTLCEGPNWVNQGTVADLIRVWDPQGQVAPGVDGATQETVVFGDVDGDGRDDYLVVFGDGSVKAWRNAGNIPAAGKTRNWEALGTIAAGVGEPGSKVRFADVDGDGMVDYLILYDGGAVKAWRNSGVTGTSNTGRKFEELGTIATGVGEPGSRVRFADVDGDGRADYLVLADDGSIRAWRNTGNLNRVEGSRNFEELGQIAAGVSGVPGSKVRLADYDGNFPHFVAILRCSTWTVD
jgi:lysophospholipase L1-like esterase